MKTQDSGGCTLLEVSFAERKKPDFLLPSPLACELVLLREDMYLQLNCFMLKPSDSVGISGEQGVTVNCCQLCCSVWFLRVLLCVAGRGCVQKR